MKRNHLCKTGAIAIIFSLVISCFTSCSQAAEGSVTPTQSEATKVSVSSSAETLSASPTPVIKQTYKDEDTDSRYDETSATKITLRDTSIVVSGTGAKASGSTVTITSAGTYIMTGTLSDGQIVIDADKKDNVRLVLNGANITNKTGAAIYAALADKLTITLVEGTQNVVTDGGSNFAYTLVADEEPNAAIFAKCDLIFNGTGSLAVHAGFNNGIGTKDDLVIVSGGYDIDATNDGLKGKDSITILDGNLKISAGGDGIQSDNSEDTAKGWVLLEGGIIEISAANDGIQAYSNLTINGGTIEVTKSYEGLEAAIITITNGMINLISTDDGINAAGGNDSETDGQLEKGSFAQTGHYSINISGGTISFVAGGDGLDSNGDLNISGGTIYAFINSTPDNGAIDVDGTFTATGGTIVYGGTGAAGIPGDNSTQSYVAVNTISEGSKISVQKDGKEIVSFTPSMNCQYLVISSPDIKSGESYDILSNGNPLDTVTGGTGNVGGMSGGNGGGRQGGKPGRPDGSGQFSRTIEHS